MFSRIMYGVAIALGCLLVLLVALVVAAIPFATNTSVSTLKSGRTVTVETGWRGMSVADSRDTTTINMNGHVIVVAPVQILVDGKMLAKIDPGVQAVSVKSGNGQITFVADNETVAKF